MSLVSKVRKVILNPFRSITYGHFGKRSDIISPMLIRGKKYIYVGEKTTIRQGARIEAIDSYANMKLTPSLVIGNNVMIEQGSHIICSKKLVIGNDTTISSYVFISDTNHSFTPKGESILKQQIESREVEIGECCFIGTGVKIMPGVMIGKGAVVGANSVVTKNIPDYCVAVGSPAKIIKKYSFANKAWETIH